MVLAELISYGSINVPTYVWQYRSENQQRSLLGTTNEYGDRRAEVDYNEYGQPYLKKILWDGSKQEYIDTVEQSGEETEIVLSAGGNTDQPVTSDMLGALVRVQSPATSPYVLFGRVTSVTTGALGTFTVEDPNGDLYDLLTMGSNPVVTVFDHHDANIGSAVHTAGLWTSNPSPGSGQTTFTIGTSVMPTHIVGWTLQPDARYPVFCTVTGASSNTVSVAGDITGTLPDVTETDVFYVLIPPPGVDKGTGALSQDPQEPTTRYLAFQYHYQPPVAGTEIESTTYGRQTADNLTGGYYCWHRRYDPRLGRWTTADPAESPWTNLLDSVTGAPLSFTDPTGCQSVGKPVAEIGGPPPSPIQKALLDAADVLAWIVFAPFRLLGLFLSAIRGDDYGWDEKVDHDWTCHEKCQYWKRKADHMVIHGHGASPGKLAMNESDLKDCLRCCDDYRYCGVGGADSLPIRGSSEWFTWLT